MWFSIAYGLTGSNSPIREPVSEGVRGRSLSPRMTSPRNESRVDHADVQDQRRFGEVGGKRRDRRQVAHRMIRGDDQRLVPLLRQQVAAQHLSARRNLDFDLRPAAFSEEPKVIR